MRRLRLLSLTVGCVLSLAGTAHGACGCSTGGIPRLAKAIFWGNDLHEIRGDCAAPGALVELQARQQHFHRKGPLPLDAPGPFHGSCINECEWTTIGYASADPITGHFVFSDLDRQQSVQLLASLWSRPGYDGVRTDLRARSRSRPSGPWSAWTLPPQLEAFNVKWQGEKEGREAIVQTRITGARKLQVSIADGPDDGDEPTIQLDVDTDTPNFWLRQNPHDSTVVYFKTGSCSPPYDCPADWLIQLAPSIMVDAPALGRHSEYPFVLGLAMASRPGSMMIATTVMGPRDMSDFTVDVDVDVDVDIAIDLDFGVDFLPIF